ncbi:MAG: hypothetical protein ACLGG5_09790, partial [Thermoleophilia bacterium]
MPHLLTLARNGFGIWPFSEGWPRVVEIYPRALTGPVNKGSGRHDTTIYSSTFPSSRETFSSGPPGPKMPST